MRTLLFLLFLFCLSAPAAGARNDMGDASSGEKADDPILVSADRLETDDSLRQVIFSGNVVARRGDLVIHSEKMTLEYGEEDRQIRRAVAAGNVRILQGERVATGEKAIFYNEEEKIVLSGSPRIKEGNDFVEGEEITVFLGENRSLVRGGAQSRVKAVFHPDKEER